MARLCIFATHPVQYHAPVFRALRARFDVDVKVFYFSDQNLDASVDPGFGVAVSWDVPLLEGYAYEFLSRDGDLARPQSIGIPDAEALLARERPDWVLLLGYTHRFEQQALLAAKKLGIKVMLRAELSDLNPDRSLFSLLFREPYLHWFYAELDAICFIGALAREHLLRRGTSHTKLFFTPYAVDDALFRQQRDTLSRGEARQRLALPEGAFTLLFSGKLIDRKDPLGLLDALEAGGVASQVHLIVLGDGELRAPFLARAEALLGPRLRAPGFVNQSQLGTYFRAADLFVMPSKFETWGLVVNEAMIFGLPVIATDRCGCHADLIRAGQTGFVVPANDPQALGEQLRWCVAHPTQCLEMGRKASQHVAGYSIERAARGIAEAMGVLPPLC